MNVKNTCDCCRIEDGRIYVSLQVHEGKLNADEKLKGNNHHLKSHNLTPGSIVTAKSDALLIIGNFLSFQ